MKKQILNLGKTLNKTEQKQINGGYPMQCEPDTDNEDLMCPEGYQCIRYLYCAPI